jgi:hypothetical protein
MKRLVKYIHFLTLIVFFSTTIGVNVYAHFCKKDGNTISYFIPNNHGCENEEEKIASCCTEKLKNNCSSTSESLSEEKCCFEKSWTVKLSTDYEVENQIKSPISFALNLTCETIIVSELSINPLFHSFCDPPPKSGKEILILHQIFRI